MAEITYQLFERDRFVLPIGQLHDRIIWQPGKSEIFQKAWNNYGPCSHSCHAICIGLAGAWLRKEKGKSLSCARGWREIRQRAKRSYKRRQLNRQQKEQRRLVMRQKQLSWTASETNADTVVGNSVLLASADKLREVFPNTYVDGEVGRQLYYSTPIVQKLAQ